MINFNRHRARHHSFSRLTNTEVGEYLCPLCKRLSNCALPLFPAIQTISNIEGFVVLK